MLTQLSSGRQAGSAVLSPSSISQDPVPPCGCPVKWCYSIFSSTYTHYIPWPGVDPGVSVIGASVSPADHTSDHIAAILDHDKRTTRVSLTRVLARVSSADVHAEIVRWWYYSGHGQPLEVTLTLQCCCHRPAHTQHWWWRWHPHCGALWAGYPRMSEFPIQTQWPPFQQNPDIRICL